MPSHPDETLKFAELRPVEVFWSWNEAPVFASFSQLNLVLFQDITAGLIPGRQGKKIQSRWPLSCALMLCLHWRSSQ
jgi:hypothetical protein